MSTASGVSNGEEKPRGGSDADPMGRDLCGVAADGYSAEDRLAAHEFLTELRTRIALVSIPYQFGVNERALESLYELFGLGRTLMRKYPKARKFGEKVIRCLNVEMRKVTGKWHAASERGGLGSRDGGDEFLADFAVLRGELAGFAKQLFEMAYPNETMPEVDETGVMSGAMDALMASLPYGIPESEELSGGIKAGVSDINSSERGEVEGRRSEGGETSRGGREEGMDAFGLALSGGGIRSASFSLGVIQVLAEEKLMPEVDFLSTVSGGGYTGSFVSAEIGGRKVPEAGVRGGGTVGASGAADPWDVLACPDGPDSAPIRTMRHRARYLSGDSLWKTWGMVTSTVAGTLLNWTAPLAVLCLVAAVTRSAKCVPKCWLTWPSPGWVFSDWPLVLWSSLVSMGMMALWYFASQRYAWKGTQWAGRTLGLTVLLGLGLGLGFVLTKIYRAVLPGEPPLNGFRALVSALRESSAWKGGLGIGGISVGVVAALVPAVARFVPFLPKAKVRRAVLKVAMYAAGVFLPLLAVTVYLFLVAVGSVTNLGEGFSGLQFLFILSGVLLLIAFFVININTTAPHRLYRDALSRTFVEGDAAKHATEGDAPRVQKKPVIHLEDLNPEKRAPYHLINAAVNLPGTEQPANRERSCDFFVFSKCWTGSPVVGYRDSADWKMNGQAPDLATAMAISGAAFSSHMGIGSIRPLRSLLTLLNVRLGFWIRNAVPPADKKKSCLKRLMAKVPVVHPGFSTLLREITGLGMTEKARWLNLSDGGHIENMGLYELLRRRCKFIVCVDGESDGAYGFQGLMNVVRYAQIDLGIRMDPDLGDLRPDEKTGLSRSHYHLMRVHYLGGRKSGGKGEVPDGVGLLLYLKLSVTGNESELIRRYRARHPEFPHQTTLDQFFDQEQFEAYRQLGVHVSRGLFARCLMGSGNPGSAAKLTVREWFRRLAGNLLLPMGEGAETAGPQATGNRSHGPMDHSQTNNQTNTQT